MGPSSYFTKGLSFLRWKALWVNLFAVRENLCCPLNLAVVTKWVCSNSQSLAGRQGETGEETAEDIRPLSFMCTA